MIFIIFIFVEERKTLLRQVNKEIDEIHLIVKTKPPDSLKIFKF